MDNDSIINSLISLKSDEKYRDFIASLVPTISKEKIIGVKIPAIRSFAKTLFINNNYEEFLNKLPHFYLEENMLHSSLLSLIKDKDEANFRLNQFLDFIDNWAVCDIMSPKVFKKHKEDLINQIIRWSKSQNIYEYCFWPYLHFLNQCQSPYTTNYFQFNQMQLWSLLCFTSTSTEYPNYHS